MVQRAIGVPKKRLGAFLAFTLAISAISASIPTASADISTASVLSCNSAANIYYVGQDGSFNSYPHNEPENGNFDWSPKQANIGSGWTPGRTLAGPDGVFYNLVPNGDLRRFRWQNGWANGGLPRVVGNGWARYSQPEHRNKVTVDEKGRLYEINPDGYLKVFVWEGDDATGSWTAETGGGKILDSGWNQYDLIVAAGDGVLYARKPGGELYRFRYHAASDRFVQYAKPVGVGWNHFNRVFSPGGDILYGTWSQNGGELLWYRYNDDTNTWADPNGARVVGTGWYNEFDVVADTNSCRLSGYPQPQHPPAVTPRFDALATVVQGDDGLPNYFFVNSQGGLVHGKQRSANDLLLVDYTQPTGYSKYTGTPGAASQENGKLEAHALGYEDGDVRGKTQTTKNSNTWPVEHTAHRGHLFGSPVLLKGSDNLISTFAADEQGVLWHRKQVVANGPFGAWRNIGATRPTTGAGGLPTDLTVVRNGDGFEIVVRYLNTLRTARFANGALGAWRDVSGADGTGKAAAVVHPDGKLQLFVRRDDNRIYTQRENSAGFPGTWQIIGGLVAKGDPAAVLTVQGTVEVAARGTLDTAAPGSTAYVHSTGQIIAGGSFRDWRSRDFNEPATDVVATGLNDGRWLFTWRDPSGDLYSYQGSFGSAVAKRGGAAGPVYTGGKTGS